MHTNLSEQEKERIAWVATIKVLTISVLIISIVAFGIYQLHKADLLLDIFIYISYAVTAGLIGLTLYGFALFLQDNIYQRKFGSRKYESWEYNTGEAPICKKVSIEYTDGKKDWNVDVDSLNWSLDAPRPIKTFFKKESGE